MAYRCSNTQCQCQRQHQRQCHFKVFRQRKPCSQYPRSKHGPWGQQARGLAGLAGDCPRDVRAIAICGGEDPSPVNAIPGHFCLQGLADVSALLPNLEVH